MPELTPGQNGFPVERAALDFIRGRELLIGHYGYWPAFTDAEVIRIVLERAPTSHAAVSNLRAVFFTFDINKAPDDPRRKQAHTEFLFGDVGNLELSDWAHQNPIEGLSITREYREQSKCDLFRVFWGGISHTANFLCSNITVVDVMDLNPFQKPLPYPWP